MIKYSPPRENNAGVFIPILLFICTALCMCFAALQIGSRLILQLVGIVCATAGIQITTRYRLCRFIYIIEWIESGEGVYESEEDYPAGMKFRIIKQQGRRLQTVCRLPLSYIVGVENAQDASIKAKYGEAQQRFNFCVNMFPRASHICVADIDGQRIEVIFEPDEGFLSELKKRIRQ